MSRNRPSKAFQTSCNIPILRAARVELDHDHALRLLREPFEKAHRSCVKAQPLHPHRTHKAEQPPPHIAVLCSSGVEAREDHGSHFLWQSLQEGCRRGIKAKPTNKLGHHRNWLGAGCGDAGWCGNANWSSNGWSSGRGIPARDVVGETLQSCQDVPVLRSGDVKLCHNPCLCLLWQAPQQHCCLLLLDAVKSQPLSPDSPSKAQKAPKDIAVLGATRIELGDDRVSHVLRQSTHKACTGLV
mmetsp:Transcript_52564/g.122291  ORF Transcript_52564/g.122291 Transcript_52564/m.122291 type:complete len:242 (+) Transcript_52564:845-1570(+)